MRILLKSLLILLFITVSTHNGYAEKNDRFDELNTLQKLFEQDEKQLDLARVKLTIDKLIDPSINIESELRNIKKMAASIQSMIPVGANAMSKMLILKEYIYTPGTWNNYQAFHYDFDDPLGTKITNKLLPNYIKSRKGNCVSMPFLFIVLGDQLGLDVTASVTPLHVLVKFTDSDEKTYNLEATSGAGFSRDSWYRKQTPMTDQAIENGVYLKRLNRKETIAVMITTYAEYLFQKKEYKKAVAVSSLSLKYYPQYTAAMLRIGTSYYQLLQKHFVSKYPNPNDIPLNQREFFHFLSNGNHYWFARAESLGWREPDRNQEEKYLEIVKRNSKNGGM